jgi:hypothetical protein
MVNVDWCHDCNNPEGICTCSVPMTPEQRITQILAPAIDARAPYAKVMIAKLVEIAHEEYLRGATDARKG